MKIIVNIRISEKQGYDTRDIAVAKLEVEAVAEFTAKALQRAVDDAIEDVTTRVGDQLRAEQRKRDALAVADDD